MIDLPQEPDSLCIFRLSAIGDVTHILPIIDTLKKAWPKTRITWIIGKLEYQLVKTLPGVEFIVFDKSKGWRAFLDLSQALNTVPPNNGRQIIVLHWSNWSNRPARRPGY